MMKHMKSVLSLLLVLCMLVSLFPASAQAVDEGLSFRKVKVDRLEQEPSGEEIDEPETVTYEDDEVVRVFIVMEEKSVMEKGYSTMNIAANQGAMAYARGLEKKQDQVAGQISRAVGRELDVRWNLTLATNAMSANVRYGDIEAIRQVEGVKEVHLVPVYELDDPIETSEPNTASSGSMVGSHNVWLEGYTGAGTRIAIIDTGLDADHPSFDASAFDYSLSVTAIQNGKTVEDYNLLTEEQIGAVLPKLNAAKVYEGLTAQQLRYSSKIAFGFNYVDENLSITHDSDYQGDHGTHVAGIAAANRYVPSGSGSQVSYAPAENGVVGIAPDAQLVIMKVFGASGGAYTDDYIAAIEDALLLGCDAVNLSLGSSAVGFTTAGDEFADSVMDRLVESDTVVSISAGNAGHWAEYSRSPVGLLYAEDSNTNRVGSPGSYSNSLAVASADNAGCTGYYFTVGEEQYVYNDNAKAAFYKLDTSEDSTGTQYDYVFLGDPTSEEDTVKYGGTAEDFAGLDVAGKIVLISRGGGIAFADKQKHAMDAGAAGAVVYNNEPGSIHMSLSYDFPCVSIRLSQMETILAASARNGEGSYTGTLTVMSRMATDMNASEGVITMSVFSSWGVPGDLSLKPEITAPGGNIYSTTNNGTYSLMSGTSMAAPSVAGMAALVAQYIRENGLQEQEGMTVRALAQSLLMGTAVPTMDPDSLVEYSPRSQGSGLANVANAVESPTYITIEGNEDGKVKAEFGDDPERTGRYAFTFQVHNLTDAPASYELEASVMAPMLVEHEGDTFAAMSNVALGADVTYTGVAFDLNGDRTADEGDVLRILRHVTGTEALAEDMLAQADLDGNGRIEAVDAQILQTLVNGGAYEDKTLENYMDMSAITVPAHGSQEVTVTILLNQEGRAYLENGFPKGTYVEGYVYLRAVTDAEGKLGVDQSIPFLGFYGGWTESSMFERYVYAEHYNDENAPQPYVYSYANYLKVHYGNSGSTYNIYGRNNYAVDQTHALERGALSAANGDSIYGFTFTMLRNAASLVYTMTDADTGEVYNSMDLGAQYGAFYYTNGGQWMNTTYSVNLGWLLTDSEGNPLPNNTRILLTLTAAPEYNVAKDGTVSGLGPGAMWTTPFTIDEEAPVVHSIQFAGDATQGEKLLAVEAQDNQYIAAINILNDTGNSTLKRFAPAEQTEANQRFVTNLDVSQIKRDVVMISVVDYAGNASVYQVELGNGTDEPVEEETRSGFFAYRTAYNNWVNFNLPDTSVLDTITKSQVAVTAAEYVNGFVFASDAAGYLYVMKHEKYEAEVVRKLDYVFQDMAYNMADGNLYGLTTAQDSEGVTHSALMRIDLLTGEATLAGYLQDPETAVSLQTLACRKDGTFFATTASSKNSSLYRFTLNGDGTPSQLELVGNTGYRCRYLQTMAFDHETDKLYWAQYYSATNKALVELNTETGAALSESELSSEMTGMYIVGEGGGSFGDGSDRVQVELIQDSLTVYSGTFEPLEAYVTPWNLKDRSIVWTSGNPEVATVNDAGVVTGIKAGTTVITATAAADPTKTDTCVVTVEEMDTTVRGLIHDGTGNEYVASINADTASVEKISGALERDYISAALVGERLYAATETTLYELDPANGYRAEKLCDTEVPFTDMAWSPKLETTFATCGGYLLAVDKDSEGGYQGAWDLSNTTGILCGITYAGYDSTYSYFYLLAASGRLYLAGIQKVSGGYFLTIIRSIPTTGCAVSGQHMNQSLLYVGDGRTGWIYWARYDGESTSSLIAINETTGKTISRGEFNSDASPVVGLHGASEAADMNRVDNEWQSDAFCFDAQGASYPSIAMSPRGSVAGLDR